MSNGDENFNHGKFQGDVMAELRGLRRDFSDLKKEYVTTIVTMNSRIRKLEDFRWYVVGAALAGGVGAGITLPKIANAFM